MLHVPGPTVGRIVHYVSAGSADGTYPSVCRAAIVTEVYPDQPTWAGLAVLNVEGIHWRCHVEQQEPADDQDGLAPYTWHWPERA